MLDTIAKYNKDSDILSHKDKLESIVFMFCIIVCFISIIVFVAYVYDRSLSNAILAIFGSVFVTGLLGVLLYYILNKFWHPKELLNI